MKTHPVVLIDMDGVLADFDGATHAHLQALDIDIPVRSRRNFYYRDDVEHPDHVEVINQLHTSQHFFRNLLPIDGALEGWQAIKELGYEPRICSSPLHTNEWCKDEKLAWIGEYLGEDAMRSAIIDRRKELYDGIALIDDRPDIKNIEQATWQHIVFDASYNQTSPATLRLMGWSDPALPQMLADCLTHAQNRP